jgi:hypothetical protein
MRETQFQFRRILGKKRLNSAGFEVWFDSDFLIFEVEVHFPFKVLTLRINNTIHNEYHQVFVTCQIRSITRAVGYTFPCQFILLVAKMTHGAKTGGIASHV